ncbi:MAG: peptidoglycan DD-metalloendopeptidase family protein [Chromatiales bacterium]|jgi:murein DD-endopeptidase MepM/ murein hydrolase activator NlpD
MRDYKPQIKTSKRLLSRKIILFIFIASIATLYFLKTEQQAPSLERPAATQIKPLPLPGIGQPTPQQAATTIKRDFIESPSDAGEPTTTVPAESVAPAFGTTTAPVMTATWESYTVKSGDSLANIFKSWNLSATTLHNIVNGPKLGKSLADIHPGEELKLLRDDAGKLLELVVQRSPTESLNINRNDDGGYSAEVVTRDVEVRHAYAHGIINSSLFVDGQSAGLTDAQIMEMAGIFGWDIDFALEIRRGDEFKLLYEEHFLDGEKLRNGPILAAEFRNDGKVYRAVRYTNPDNETGYFDPQDGRNKKRAFIRTPVKFARISSGFTTSRYHPKLKKWRAHRGVDYAAPTGTPVKAAGNGKVTFRGWKGGYGRVIFIQHGSKYTTVYAHLSKYARASRQGKQVQQGQIIGYVGQSGLATGPHLHYEFRVNGVHRNPLTIKLPKAEPIDKKYREDFDQDTAPIIAELRTYTEHQVAQLENPAQDAN